MAVKAFLAALMTMVGFAGFAPAPADVVIVNGRVYTLAWDEPDREGRPAANAPHTPGGWHPDAQAVAIRGGRITLVGSNAQALTLKGAKTQIVDADVHIAELGASLDWVSLVGVKTDAEAVERVEARARQTPKGQWIVGWGW